MTEQLRKNVLQQARIILSLAFLVTLIGVSGFMLIEGWGFLDSLYMTAITLTTVGFREVGEPSSAGKVFTILLITCGVGTWAYAFGSMFRLLVEGQLRNYFYQRRMEKMLDSMKKHFIVCGFGRIGMLVCRQLAEEKIPFVVVERKPSIVEELAKLEYLYVEGDASAEEVLLKAGIERARGLIAVLGTDAGNVYTVLTARYLNAKLYIVCRSEDEEAEDKIQKAGANRVISPYRIGGRSLANAAMRPHVLDFIDLVTSRKDLELGLEEVPIPAGSHLAGKTIVGTRIRERFGTIIVACRTSDNVMIFNPPADHLIQAGDVLIALGNRDCLENLDRGLDLGDSGYPGVDHESLLENQEDPS
ncbi:MAG: potassium channel protein [Planctomycetes bacterium]|nr:potassium channel protein [Planctomycetota bacterium]